jgi:hypothetical protein
MIIRRKRNDDILINNKNDFVDYINTIIKNIKQYDLIPFVNDLNKLYDNNQNYFKKSFDNIIKNYFYSLTILNKKYWIVRGWTEYESIEKIKNIQLSNNKKNILKQLELRKNSYDKWSSKRVTNINYYLSKGFNLEDSEKLLKNRQRTFSLELCIKKYGEEKGRELFKNRQIKWINTLSKIEYNTDSHSVNKLIEKFGKNWINIALHRYDYNENYLYFIKYAVENNLTIKQFLKYVDNESELITITDYYPFFKSKILQYIYNVTFDEFRIIFLKNIKIIITNYGNIRYFNDHITRSNGEYEIAKFLVKNNIEYVYEQKYPNSKYICDFYLKQKDLYIEYMGFLKSNYLTKTNEDIIKKYKLKIDKKICLCQNNNINLYCDNSVKNIINKIKYEYEIK